MGPAASSRLRGVLRLFLVAGFLRPIVAYRLPVRPCGGSGLQKPAARRSQGWVYCRSSQLPDLPTWWRDPSQLRLQEESAPKGADRAPKKGTKSSSGFLRGLRRLAFSGLAILGASGPSLMPLPALAADSFKIGSCLLKNCQLELGRCLLDGKCLANIICLNTCNGKENEVGCQIGCGNLFENEVVGEFNGCALTKKQCVPQKQDDGSYPVPPDSALIEKFDMKSFEGKWYIAAGLNPLFDIFDCQVHFFNLQPSGTLYAKLNWRILEPDGEFFERNTIQKFVQDPVKPGIMYNHDNEYLHYQDDWYILDAVPDQYILVYYRGQNDAWIGYGGAVVYTRAPSVPRQYIPRIKAAFAKAGVDYGKFVETDNSCKDQTENKYALRVAFIERLFRSEEQNLAQALTTARTNAKTGVVKEEQEAAKALSELESSIADFQKKIGVEYSEVVRTVEKGLEDVEGEVEAAIDTNVWRLRNQNELDSLTNKVNGKPLTGVGSK